MAPRKKLDSSNNLIGFQFDAANLNTDQKNSDSNEKEKELKGRGAPKKKITSSLSLVGFDN